MHTHETMWCEALFCFQKFLDFCTVAFSSLFDKYYLIIDQLDLKDSSRDLQTNCIINFYFYLYLILVPRDSMLPTMLPTQTTGPRSTEKKSPMTTLPICSAIGKAKATRDPRAGSAGPGWGSSPCVPQPTCLTSGPGGKQLLAWRSCKHTCRTGTGRRIAGGVDVDVCGGSIQQLLGTGWRTRNSKKKWCMCHVCHKRPISIAKKM